MAETGVFLHANERRQVIGEGVLDGIGADPTPIDPSRRGDYLLGAGIDAVLIGEDVDSESLDEPPPCPPPRAGGGKFLGGKETPQRGGKIPGSNSRGGGGRFQA
jgi:hypothetical protein